MATKFIEPGGDADFAAAGGLNNFWASSTGTSAVATDFVHGSHIKSIKYRAANGDILGSPSGSVADSGTRISMYIYLVALPGATTGLFTARGGGGDQTVVKITSGGILQLWNGTIAQIGTNGSTLSTGVWYRLSLAYTITSTTVNRFEFFLNGVSNISVTNATVQTGASIMRVGNLNTNSTLDFRSSDHYIDNSASLTDTGNIWVTAKRPKANGTTNGFTTQIGSGGSGYGSGHSPQVNERPLSTTNGWSMIGAGSAITEEYNIEGKSTGDIDISAATIIDYTGWVSAKTLNAETASIVVNGVSSNISLGTSNTLFTKIAGSASYPAGIGTDIGIVTTTALTTVSLYECGVIVAYIPAAASTANGNFLAFM